MKRILLALFFCAFATCANAASCFWVGGTGTWSTSNAASWSSSSGGTASTCAATGGIPKQAADTATFDANSGAGTVTVDTTLNGATLTEIVYTAGSVSLDFSANNPSLTFTGAPGFNITGAGQTVNCGTGTFTFTGANNSTWNYSATSTLTCASNTMVLAYSGALNGTQQFAGGGKTYGTLTLTGPSTATNLGITGTGNTFATINITGPATVQFPGGSVNTITNAFNWAGTAANPLRLVSSSSSSISTIHASAASTIAWAYIAGLTFNTSSVTASNSFDGRSNTGVTITPPSTGGGGIIGGGI